MEVRLRFAPEHHADHRAVDQHAGEDPDPRTADGSGGEEGRRLGRGGMGVVYLARAVALDRPVAIELLPPILAAQPTFRERFLREARTAARLAHPHIAPIHSVAEREGFVFFVMGYVPGRTLGQQ